MATFPQTVWNINILTLAMSLQHGEKEKGHFGCRKQHQQKKTEATLANN